MARELYFHSVRRNRIRWGWRFFALREIRCPKRRVQLPAETAAAFLRVLCERNRSSKEKEKIMLGWALLFFIVALVAAIFGFGGIAAGASSIAQILFFVFLVLFIVSLVAGAVRGRPPV